MWQQAVADGALVLTVNRRLARHLTHLYDQGQLARGLEVWPSADILSWGAWLERALDATLDHDAAWPAPPPHLLTPAQEEALWQAVVEEEEPGLLHPALAAAQAQQAWAVLKEWRLVLREEDVLEHEDAAAFWRWCRRYQTLCRQQGWAGAALAPELVRERLAYVPAPTRVLLAGFDRLTPQQEALLAAWQERGVAVVELPPARLDGRAERVGLADGEQELWAAARWSRQRLEAEPGARVGVVVRDLAARRAQVERIWRAVFQPGGALATGGVAGVNFSLGGALGASPLVADALLLLELAGGRMALEALGGVLRSPFWRGAVEEAGARARLDAGLRARRWRRVTLAALERAALPTCPQLAAALGRVRRLGPLPEQDAPSAWARRFAQWLALLGWPGERRLASEAFQTVEAWRKLLAELASLEPVTPRLGRSEALARLRRLAAERLFQPEGSDAPVQVMGMLEASGMRFDALWVAGLDEEHWPAAPAPNPFLPLAWQRRQGIPRATAEMERAFAVQVTDRLLHAAAEVVVSYPLREGDRALRPAPLIAHLPETTPAALGLMADDPRQSLALARAWSEEEDATAPSLGAGEAASGGAALLRDQSLCPFRAFARRRLGAEPLEEVEPGLDARQRGELAHRVLERLWTELGGGAGLASRSAAQVAALAQALAEAVVAEAGESDAETFTPAFRLLESRRLARLASAEAELERGRDPAFQLLAREDEIQIAIGGLSLKARPDRVDRLADGALVVLDYKTGEVGVREWFGERPRDPQLPLYCADLARRGHTVAALAFARLKPGQVALVGVARTAGLLPGLQEGDLPTWLDQWWSDLTALAEEFRQGEARVHPQSGACQYCDLPLLCRIPPGWRALEEEQADG